jgi:hypothetical protein
MAGEGVCQWDFNFANRGPSKKMAVAPVSTIRLTSSMAGENLCPGNASGAAAA